jgi:8-oxo-dGTP pyrophosphatase MutT (NUDIX family)
MFTTKWFDDSKLSTDLPVRQVYVWLLDKAGNVVIVSKDGENWQMPGGKPNVGEPIQDTAVREALEETGLDISGSKADIKIFGYYGVEELDDASKVIDRFVQVRTWLKFDYWGVLEPKEPEDSEAVKYAKAVPLGDLPKYITWIAEKDEYLRAKELVKPS